MELKLTMSEARGRAEGSSNCTFMELKYYNLHILREGVSLF